MDRIGYPLSAKGLTFKHANNTLVITVSSQLIQRFDDLNQVILFIFDKYDKPQVYLDMEKRISAELSKTKASKDGDVECNPS
jgi:hypothetical protein